MLIIQMDCEKNRSLVNITAWLCFGASTFDLCGGGMMLKKELDF